MCDARSTKTPSSSSTEKDEPSANAAASSRSEPKLIATATCAPVPIEIDIRNLSAEDLQSLKQDDPFLYYSIPAFQRATFNLTEPDMSESSWEESTAVKRRTRVSFECHADLLMADLLGDFEEQYYQSELELMDLEFSKLLGLAYDRYNSKTQNQ
eukprot:scaffold18732_cov157-Skeletonema_menzelii.AAC.2